MGTVLPTMSTLGDQAPPCMVHVTIASVFCNAAGSAGWSRGAWGQALLQPPDKGFDGGDTVGLGRLQLSVFARVLEEMGRDRHNLQPLKPQPGSSIPLITGSGSGRGVCRTLVLHAHCNGPARDTATIPLWTATMLL